MKKIKYIILMIGLLLTCFMFKPNETEAATSTSNLTMVVNSGCYTYSKKTATADYRVSFITFGEEIEVISISQNWAKIKYDNKIQYILVKNIDYIKNSVVKNRVMVSPKAYATSSKNSLGYVYYGTEISVIDEIKNSNGDIYVQCLIDKTYEKDGVTVKNTNVEGYINKAYLDTKSTPKVISNTTNLYQYAFSTSSSSEMKEPVSKIYVGEQVEVLMSNTTWSKVLYNNEEYYVYTNKLDDLKLEVLVNRVMQTKDAKPGSGYVHYLYWNAPITVLDTYESDTYGTYYYCNIDGDYGFVREYSTSGIKYVGYQKQMITNRAINLYKKASTSSTVLKKIDSQEKVTIIYQNDTYSLVSYNDKIGYVLTKRLEYPVYKMNGNYHKTGYRLYKNKSNGKINDEVYLLAIKDKYDYAYIETTSGDQYWIKASSLYENEKIYKYTINPSTTLHLSAQNSSDYITIPYMSEIEYIGIVSDSSSGMWIKVKYENKYYYIWLDNDSEYFTDTKSKFEYEGNNKYQNEVIELAVDIYKNWDTKYAHGQSNGIADTDGKYGFDCSGLASYVLDSVMKKYVPTYNISSDIDILYETGNIYNEGYQGEYDVKTILDGDLDISKLQPGDILFFSLEEEENPEKDFNHCGIYLGNGEFVHSSSSWNKTTIMPLSGMYVDGFISAKRYLPTTVKSADTILYTTSQKTNVFSELSDSSEILVTLEADIPVTLLFTNSDNWAYVEYEDGKYGYILVKYLTDELVNYNETRYVIKDNLKLYSDHTTNSSYISVSYGTKVTYIRRYSNSSYYLITYQNKEYYLYAPNGIDTVLSKNLD